MIVIHSDEAIDISLLGCNTMCTLWQIPTFWRNILSPCCMPASPIHVLPIIRCNTCENKHVNLYGTCLAGVTHEEKLNHLLFMWLCSVMLWSWMPWLECTGLPSHRTADDKLCLLLKMVDHLLFHSSTRRLLHRDILFKSLYSSPSTLVSLSCLGMKTL
jgi:hypothetical protein